MITLSQRLAKYLSLRRNPKLADTWPVWEEARGDYNTKILHAPEDMAPGSPCLWASSTASDATDATVIWNPKDTNFVLPVVALPPRAGFGGQILDLAHIGTEKTLLLAQDGTQHLVLRDGPRSLQLNVRGTPLTEPVTLFTDIAASDCWPKGRIDLLRRFHALRTSGGLPKSCFAPHPYARRAMPVLIALDGYLAGIAHREIAVAMFGASRVERARRGLDGGRVSHAPVFSCAGDRDSPPPSSSVRVSGG